MGFKLMTTTSFSALALLVGSFDHKTRPNMTHNVFSGTLNPVCLGLTASRILALPGTIHICYVIVTILAIN